MNGTPESDDAGLIARSLAGDARAFAQIVQRHQSSLYGFARRYVGDADAAMEIAQETFVAAWRALARYDRARSFPVWLRAIALNKCRDRARRLAVRRAVFADSASSAYQVETVPDRGVDAEASLIDRQRRAALEAAIARLPAKLKEPLLLTYFEDYTQQEAADLLKISVKAVETRVYRARQKLSAMLGGPAT